MLPFAINHMTVPGLDHLVPLELHERGPERVAADLVFFAERPLSRQPLVPAAARDLLAQDVRHLVRQGMTLGQDAHARRTPGQCGVLQERVTAPSSICPARVSKEKADE